MTTDLEQGRLSPTEERRRERQETRASQTYKEFLKYLERVGDLTEETAEEAAVSVLCVLEQRITGNEAHDLEAQLPRKLRELVQRCERHEGVKPRSIGKKEFLAMVADHIGEPAEEIEPIVRAVFQAVRAQISAGEVEDVASQLPGDLRELWQPTA